MGKLHCPETDLLFLCAQKTVDDVAREKIIERCHAPLDWKLLERAAANHKLSALLYNHLKRTCWELVPAETAQSLRDSFIERARLQWMISDEFVKLCTSFSSQNIRYVSFKGPVLAEQLYGAVELREFDDLDIFVARADVVKTIDLLRNAGFHPFPWNNCTDLSDQFMRSDQFLNLASDHTFKNETTGTIVDLHWLPLPNAFFAMNESDLLERITAVSINETATRTFDRDTLLLILCAHATKHAWSKIGWITDVAELINSMSGDSSPDWTRVMSLAKLANCKQMLLLGFALSARIGAIAMPQSIEVELLKTPRISRLADQLIEHYRCDPCAPQWRKRKTWLFHWLIMDGYQAKLKLIYHNCLEPTLDEWATLPLPPSLGAFYYFFRPFNVLAEYVKAKL